MGYGNTSQYQIQYQILISESLFTNPFTLFLIPKNQILRLGSRICDNDKLSMITYHLILMRHKLYRSTSDSCHSNKNIVLNSLGMV